MVPYEPDVCNRKRRKGTELSLWLPRRDAGHLDGATERFCARFANSTSAMRLR